MASKRSAVPARHLFNGFRAQEHSVQRCFVRSMATEAPLPGATTAKTYLEAEVDSAPTQPILEDKLSVPPATTSSSALHSRPTTHQPPQNPFLKPVQVLLHAFPSLEPSGFATYPSTHLAVPLRRDILHRAVIYEADMSRQGTASTKWRSEIHGSGRKIRPQKGTGSARLGDKKSPMLRGGGVAFGPKPRDFATDLPRKIYDLAWRTALSYRWRMGELMVVDGACDIQGVYKYSLDRYVRDFLGWNNMGRAGGRTLFVSEERRDELFDALAAYGMGKHASALEVDMVDVKDLLEKGRVVIEKRALDMLLKEHQNDLPIGQKLRMFQRRTMDANAAPTVQQEQVVL